MHTANTTHTMFPSAPPAAWEAGNSPSSLSESTPDARIIELCKQGDASAWNVLIRRYEKPVYKFAYSLARNHDDAADIAGQVFLRIYENIHTFRNHALFSYWLFRVVRNVYIDLCVRSVHRGTLSLDNGLEVNGDMLTREIEDPSPTPEQHCLETETQHLLRKAIGCLPKYQRDIMELYHGQGRSYEEIAQTTGLSLGTVKSRLSRARQMLRERLSDLEEVLVAV